jgi:hypothetical protein
MPENGDEIRFTFMPRERNEGYGDVNAIIKYNTQILKIH